MSLVFYLLVPLLFDWKVLKSEHFTTIYTDPVAWQARQILQYAEIHKPYIDELTGNKEAHLPFVVEDIGMYANGYADPFMNHIHIYPYTPHAIQSIEGTENWLRTVTVHEYTHATHLTLARGCTHGFQSVFGSIFSPNMYSPGWIIEGMAVFSESYISPYEGRLNEGFYDTYIHALNSNDVFPNIVDITNNPLSFPYDTYYLYGGVFFNFLAEKYGVERFARFTKRNATFLWAPIGVFFPCIGIDAAARYAYGRSFPALYREWHAAELLMQHPDYNGARRITFSGWYISSLTANDSMLYYVRSRSVKVDAFVSTTRYEIVQYDPATDQQQTLKTLPSSVNTSMQIHNNNLYYTTTELQTGMANSSFNRRGYVNTLTRIDLRSHHCEKVLTERIRSFCVISDDSIIISTDKEETYGSTLWTVTPDGQWYTCSCSLLVEEFLCTPDLIMVIAKPEFSNTDIYTLDIKTGSLSPIASSPWSEAFLQHGSNGRIGFTSNIDGNHALYEIDMSTGMIFQIPVQGYARDGITFDRHSNARYFIGLTADGFDLFSAHLEPQSFDSSWNILPVCSPVVLPEISKKPGSYCDIISTLVPRVRVPLVIPADNNFRTWLYGALFIGQDAVQENTYYAYLAYNSDADDPYIRAQWQSNVLSPLSTNVFFSNDELNYTAVLPLYTRLHYGLHNASIFLSGRTFENFTRKEISPGIAWQLHYPYTTLHVAISFPYERIAWQSSLNRSSQFLSVTGQRTFTTSRLRCKMTIFSDRNNPDSLQIQIRGTDAFQALQGYVLRAEYSHKIFALHWGLWNPNVYFEDVFATVFCDYGRSSRENHAYSIGIEIRPEIKAGFGYLQFSPRIGCAYTDENRITWFFRLVSHIDAPYLTFCESF